MSSDEHIKPEQRPRPDSFQLAWQALSSQTRVTVDADLMRSEVQRNQQQFRATIFCRDFREVLVAILLIPLWFYLGATYSQPWTWYLVVPGLLWIVGFFVVDRRRQPQRPTEPGSPLLTSVRDSLKQVEHQIWLLRNVFWWYLLPIAVPALIYIAHVSARSIWLNASDGWEALSIAAVKGGIFVEFLAIFCFLDYINQRAVRKQLEPRRQELLTLQNSLSGDESPEASPPPSTSAIASSSVFKRWFVVAALSLMAFAAIVIAMAIAGGSTDSTYNGPPQSSGPSGQALARLVTDERKQKNLVGLAAMVTVDGRLEAAAAQGERKLGTGVPLQITDRWHLGGITKSITATMIARLVESGKMQWSDTIGDAFPDAPIDADWKQVTLQQLLTDTAGAPVQFPLALRGVHPPLGPESTQVRRDAILDIMAQKPMHAPGEQFEYSNVGYTIAAAMAEQKTGDTWENLVQREVFDPLQLTESGFGPPKSGDDTLEQPRGHHPAFSGKIAVNDEADNTPIMGPAGSVHLSLRDLSTFATEHLRGDLGNGTLLSKETYKLLHAPAHNGYAFGWIKKDSVEAIPYTTVYWHNGSNTMWYSLVVFLPEKSMVVAVTSNDGDYMSAESAAWEIVKKSANGLSGDANPPADDQPRPPREP